VRMTASSEVLRTPRWRFDSAQLTQRIHLAAAICYRSVLPSRAKDAESFGRHGAATTS